MLPVLVAVVQLRPLFMSQYVAEIFRLRSVTQVVHSMVFVITLQHRVAYLNKNKPSNWFYGEWRSNSHGFNACRFSWFLRFKLNPVTLVKWTNWHEVFIISELASDWRLFPQEHLLLLSPSLVLGESCYIMRETPTQKIGEDLNFSCCAMEEILSSWNLIRTFVNLDG